MLSDVFQNKTLFYITWCCGRVSWPLASESDWWSCCSRLAEQQHHPTPCLSWELAALWMAKASQIFLRVSCPPSHLVLCTSGHYPSCGRILPMSHCHSSYPVVWQFLPSTPATVWALNRVDNAVMFVSTLSLGRDHSKGFVVRYNTMLFEHPLEFLRQASLIR